MTDEPVVRVIFNPGICNGWEPGMNTNTAGIQQLSRADAEKDLGVSDRQDSIVTERRTDACQRHGGYENRQPGLYCADKLGGKILMPVQKVPTVGQIALVSDPEGNQFGLLQPERQ